MSQVVTLICVPLATGLAYAAHFTKIFILATSFDNTRPRDIESAAKNQSAERRELVTRLSNAHTNQLETLGLFAAGVAATIATNASKTRSMAAAITYVSARAVYIIAYAAPQIAFGLPRTGIFTISIATLIWLWAESISAVARQ